MTWWLPIDKIEKAKDKEGNEVMRICGIASTNDEDTDGERINPLGLDTSYFEEQGFINWNHQGSKDPNYIIGRPSKVNVTKSGMYVEADLYPDNPYAVGVWNLMKNIEKSGDKGNGIGFSIEGSATKRDNKNPKIIEEAMITGLAVTHQPKNFNTYATIMKSMAAKKEIPHIEENEKMEECTAENCMGKEGEFCKSCGKIKKATIEDIKPLIKEELDSKKVQIKKSLENLLKMDNQTQVDAAIQKMTALFKEAGIDLSDTSQKQPSAPTNTEVQKSVQNDLVQTNLVDVDIIKAISDKQELSNANTEAALKLLSKQNLDNANLMKGLFEEMMHIRQLVNTAMEEPVNARKSIDREPVAAIEKGFEQPQPLMQGASKPLTGNQVSINDRNALNKSLRDLYDATRENNPVLSEKVKNSLYYPAKYPPTPDILSAIKTQQGIEFVKN